MKTLASAICLLILTLLSFPSGSQELVYPPTIQRDVINTYHGIEVHDRYQWLENIYSPEVRVWVESQTSISSKFLKRLEHKHNSENLMNDYMAREQTFSISSDYNFDNERVSNYRLYHNDYYSGPSIYYREHSYNDYKILIDSRYLFKKSEKKNPEIVYFEPSPQDDRLAFQYTINGKPWGEIQIKSIDGINSPKEKLYQTELYNINWYGNGFFYQSSKTDSVSGDKKSPALYYHQLYTSQKSDSLVFKTGSIYDEVNLYSTVEEDFYLLEIENRAKRQFSYLYWKPGSPYPGFKPIVYKVDYTLDFVDYIDGRLLLKAIINDKPQLISLNPDDSKDVKVIGREYQNAIMTYLEIIDNKYIAITYQSLNKPFLAVIDTKGNLIGEIELPGGVTVSNLSYQKESKKLFFLLESYTIPRVICEADLRTFTFKTKEKTGVNFDFESYKFDIMSYESFDGQEIPIFIVYKNELRRDENTPVLLESYGGMGRVNTARYNPEAIYTLENGGIYAFAHVRGGGELGNKWWRDAKHKKKETAVKDLLSAANFLIQEKYTSAKKIAISGSAHGGLLAAAALTKRPDLFGVAIISDGLMDMLRFENTAYVSALIDEFGTPGDSTEFNVLTNYSPYHHINNKVNYPPTLLVSTFYDPRYSPFHSYKFAAALQNNPAQTNPTLLLTNAAIGNYTGESIYDHLELKSMKMAFLHEFLLKKR